MGIIIWPVTFVILILVSSATAKWCDRCTHQSTATFFESDARLSKGSCWYGNLATRLKGGRVASAHQFIYQDGDACGACFQVRCNRSRVCKEQGTTVIVTDVIASPFMFVLSKTAFVDMAMNGIALPPAVGVQYQRVPCNYGQVKMRIRVYESSQKKIGFLTIVLLYQGGQTNVVLIELIAPTSKKWMKMTHENSGAVWAAYGVPDGPLRFKFTSEGNKTYTTKGTMPGNWNIGTVFDSKIQITEVATPEECKICSNVWK